MCEDTGQVILMFNNGRYDHSLDYSFVISLTANSISFELLS